MIKEKDCMVCDICGETFRLSYNYRQHIKKCNKDSIQAEIVLFDMELPPNGNDNA